MCTASTILCAGIGASSSSRAQALRTCERSQLWTRSAAVEKQSRMLSIFKSGRLCVSYRAEYDSSSLEATTAEATSKQADSMEDNKDASMAVAQHVASGAAHSGGKQKRTAPTPSAGQTLERDWDSSSQPAADGCAARCIHVLRATSSSPQDSPPQRAQMGGSVVLRSLAACTLITLHVCHPHAQPPPTPNLLAVLRHPLSCDVTRLCLLPAGKQVILGNTTVTLS